jgi:hypothetical protein
MRSGIGPDKLLFAKDLPMVIVLVLLSYISNYFEPFNRTYRSVSAVRFAISGDIDPEMPILDKFLV